MEDPSQQSANAGAMLSSLAQNKQNSSSSDASGGGEGRLTPGGITGASGYSASSMFSEATSALFGSLPEDGYLSKMFADVASFASSVLEAITGLFGDLGNLGVLGAALKDAVFRGMSDDKSVAGIGGAGEDNGVDSTADETDSTSSTSTTDFASRGLEDSGATLADPPIPGQIFIPDHSPSAGTSKDKEMGA